MFQHMKTKGKKKHKKCDVIKIQLLQPFCNNSYSHWVC
jgi:hypothetical protein